MLLKKAQTGSCFNGQLFFRTPCDRVFGLILFLYHEEKEKEKGMRPPQKILFSHKLLSRVACKRIIKIHVNLILT